MSFATAADDVGSSVGVAADVFGECFGVGFVDDGVADDPRYAGIRLHPDFRCRTRSMCATVPVFAALRLERVGGAGTGARVTQPGELASDAAGALPAGLGAHHQGYKSARLISATRRLRRRAQPARSSGRP